MQYFNKKKIKTFAAQPVITKQGIFVVQDTINSRLLTLMKFRIISLNNLLKRKKYGNKASKNQTASESDKGNQMG